MVSDPLLCLHYGVRGESCPPPRGGGLSARRWQAPVCPPFLRTHGCNLPGAPIWQMRKLRFRGGGGPWPVSLHPRRMLLIQLAPKFW